MKAFLSVIVPIYNELPRLHNIVVIHDYLQRQDFSSEFIVVDDGSGPKTKHALVDLEKKYKFRLISYAKNQGKGFAIKTGMLAASGKYRLFTDLDLSTPIESFSSFFSLLEEYPVVIGSRKIPGAQVLVHQNFLRENMGKVFTFLSQQMLQLQIFDFTCGFKCFSEDAASKIFSHLTIKRWGFDSESLFLAHLYGFGIKEVPVKWENEPNTRVKFPRDAITSFYELLKIRSNNVKGLYRL
jgi:dolichyl-phosphate beta-glucosyltransferase